MSEQPDPHTTPNHRPAQSSTLEQLLHLMAGLLENHVDDCAVLICTTSGRVVWANPFACDRAKDWPLFSHNEKFLYIHDEQVLHKLANGNPDVLSLQLTAEESVYQFEVAMSLAQPAGADGLARVSIICQKIDLREHPDFKTLSPAELRLVCMLEKHFSLKKSARILDISYENARTTLKHVFCKLNVHSQEQLREKVSNARG